MGARLWDREALHPQRLFGEVRVGAARPEHIREAIGGWKRKFEGAEDDGRRTAVLRLEWMEWLDAQRRYGYIQLMKGDKA